MPEDKIKEAFQKVKEDISLIKEQLEELKRTIRQTDTQTYRQTDTNFIPTIPQTLPTETQTTQTINENAKNKSPLEGSKNQFSDISTGNKGVQTDRQTNQQTDRQTDNYLSQSISRPMPVFSDQKFVLNQNSDDPIKRIEKVAEVVNSLDALKKDLRKQFKQLTPQEMLVFSTIYQLTDQSIDVDYSILSKKTSLSESSIRDYVQKIIKKGVPLEKIRENNKRIILAVPPEFKRIASLDTIISLRDL